MSHAPRLIALFMVMTLTVPALTSCKSAGKVVDQATETTANLVLPPSEEMKLGRELATELERGDAAS